MTEYLKGKLEFNIAELLTQTTQTQDDVYLEISPCKVLSGFETIDIEQINKIRFEFENAQAWVYVTLNNGTIIPYDDIQTENPSGIIELYGASYYEDVPDITAVITKMDNDYSIFTYRLNSERNVIDKNLISVGILIGYFRNSINIKSPIINIENYEIVDTFNYIFIPSLNRYYYVTNIELSTKNIATLSLAEDVLMSHKDLIKRQTGYIERNEYTYNAFLNDDRRIITEDNIISYQEQTETSIFEPIADGQVNYEYKYVITVFRG